jgi:hypothetical protein
MKALAESLERFLVEEREEALARSLARKAERLAEQELALVELETRRRPPWRPRSAPPRSGCGTGSPAPRASGRPSPPGGARSSPCSRLCGRSGARRDRLEGCGRSRAAAILAAAAVEEEARVPPGEDQAMTSRETIVGLVEGRP